MTIGYVVFFRMNVSAFIYTIVASFSSVHTQQHHGVHYHGNTQMDDHDGDDLYKHVNARAPGSQAFGKPLSIIEVLYNDSDFLTHFCES